MASRLRIVRRLSIATVAVVAAAVVAARVGGVLEGSAPRLGAVDGRLAPCRASPNCVSSQADPADAVHYVAPLPVAAHAGGAHTAFSDLRRIVAASPRAAIVGEAPGYLRAEFRSRVLGFVDDVELLLDAGAGVVHVRSASRLGRGDFGVNRARVERLRAQLAGTGRQK